MVVVVDDDCTVCRDDLPNETKDVILKDRCSQQTNCRVNHWDTEFF